MDGELVLRRRGSKIAISLEAFSENRFKWFSICFIRKVQYTRTLWDVLWHAPTGTRVVRAPFGTCFDASLEDAIIKFSRQQGTDLLNETSAITAHQHGPVNGHRLYLGFIFSVMYELRYTEWLGSTIGTRYIPFPYFQYSLPAIMTFLYSLRFGCPKNIDLA